MYVTPIRLDLLLNTELVVVGFNSGKYDLNVLKDILIPHLVHCLGIDLTIKRHHAHRPPQVCQHFQLCGGRHQLWRLPQSLPVSGGEGVLSLRTCPLTQSAGGISVIPARGLPLLVEEELVE